MGLDVDLVPLPPRKSFRLPVPRVIGNVGMRGKFDAGLGESRRRPAGGRRLGIRHIRRGRRVDDVDPAVFRKTAVVDVPVDVGFNVIAGRQNVPEFLRIDQSPRKVIGVAAESRVVMGDDNGGLVREPFERSRKPVSLHSAQVSLCDHRLLERIEEKEVDESRLDHRDVPGLNQRILGALVVQAVKKHIPLVVITQRAMQPDLRFSQRANQFREVPVIARLTVLERQVAVDQHGGRLFGPRDDLADDLSQIARDGRIRGMLLSDVRVVQQIDDVVVRFDTLARARQATAPAPRVVKKRRRDKGGRCTGIDATSILSCRTSRNDSHRCGRFRRISAHDTTLQINPHLGNHHATIPDIRGDSRACAASPCWPKIGLRFWSSRPEQPQLESTTPVMQGFLEDSGKFIVSVATTPPKKSKPADWEAFDPDFFDYDVVLSNYNGELWPESVQKRLEAYVKQGGGLVIVHAANNAFPQWSEFNKMIGLGWRNNKFGRSRAPGSTTAANGCREHRPEKVPGAGHGRQHEFAVRDSRYRASRHRRTCPPEWLHVQRRTVSRPARPGVRRCTFWRPRFRPRQARNRRPRADDLVDSVRRRQSLHDRHGSRGLFDECIGFQTTVLRGAEWVAIGEVTIPIPDNFPTGDKVSEAK